MGELLRSSVCFFRLLSFHDTFLSKKSFPTISQKTKVLSLAVTIWLFRKREPDPISELITISNTKKAFVGFSLPEPNKNIKVLFGTGLRNTGFNFEAKTMKMT